MSEKRNEDREKIYHKQQKIGLFSFVAELPNFVMLFVSALFSNTLIVWMDLVDSFSNVARSGIVVLSSRKLKKKDVMNIGQIERRASLMCDCSVMLGIVCVFGASIYELFYPAQPANFIIYTIGLKLCNITIDLIMLIKQLKLNKAHPTPVVKAELDGFVKDTSFDVIACLTLVVCSINREQLWSWYISPVVCLIMGVYFLVKYSRNIVSKLKG